MTKTHPKVDGTGATKTGDIDPLKTRKYALRRPEATLAAVLIFTLVGGLVGHWSGKGAALSESIDDLNKYSELHQHQLSTLITRYNLMPEAFSACPCIKQALETPESRERVALSNRALEQIARLTRVAAIYAMDTQGNTVVSSNWNQAKSFVGKNYSIRPYFMDAMTHGNGQYVALGITSRVLGVYLARRVDGSTGPLGVVVVKISLDEINSWLHENAKKIGIEFAVTDEDGVSFLSSNPQWQYRPIAPLSEQEHAAVVNSRRYEGSQLQALPIHHQKALDGKHRLVHIGPGNAREYVAHRVAIENTPWHIEIFQPTAAHNPTVYSHTIIGAVSALAAALAIIITMVRTAYQQQLLNIAIRDPLTGLYSRFYMNEAIPALIARHSRDENAGLVVILFDLDRFKQINDKYGHVAGDKVLQTVGNILRGHVRQSDIAARYGGEELIVFLQEKDIESALKLAERIRRDIAGYQFDIDSRDSVQLTISAGLAVHNARDSMSDWIEKADRKLYEAKSQGRNRVCY